jgi:hypothetical protein
MGIWGKSYYIVTGSADNYQIVDGPFKNRQEALNYCKTGEWVEHLTVSQAKELRG